MWAAWRWEQLGSGDFRQGERVAHESLSLLSLCPYPFISPPCRRLCPCPTPHPPAKSPRAYEPHFSRANLCSSPRVTLLFSCRCPATFGDDLNSC